MNTTDTLQLVGDFSVLLDYHQGKGKEIFFEKKNLITSEAKRYLLSSLYANNVISDPIATFHAGSGGCIDLLGFYPKAENPNQTGLYVQEISVATNYVVNTVDITVTFLADIDMSEGNGILFTEAGLFKESGLMFHVKNHPVILKNSEFSIHYE